MGTKLKVVFPKKTWRDYICSYSLRNIRAAKIEPTQIWEIIGIVFSLYLNGASKADEHNVEMVFVECQSNACLTSGTKQLKSKVHLAHNNAHSTSHTVNWSAVVCCSNWLGVESCFFQGVVVTVLKWGSRSGVTRQTSAPVPSFSRVCTLNCVGQWHRIAIKGSFREN